MLEADDTFWTSLAFNSVTAVLRILKACSFSPCRGTAVTMKKMLETEFPGLDVILANYPAPAPKRLLAKVVPVVQMGVIGMIVAGDRVFPLIGIAQPPAWFNSLRANRFGSMASTWLVGNFLQSYLQSSGAFEVLCNGEPVSSINSLINECFKMLKFSHSNLYHLVVLFAGVF